MTEHVAHIPRRYISTWDTRDVPEKCPGDECSIDRTIFEHYLVRLGMTGRIFLLNPVNPVETMERTETTTVIQMRDLDISDEWSDEHVITHMLSGVTPESYFESWGKNSGFEFRLIERITEIKTHERVISEKKT